MTDSSGQNGTRDEPGDGNTDANTNTDVNNELANITKPKARKPEHMNRVKTHKAESRKFDKHKLTNLSQSQLEPNTNCRISESISKRITKHASAARQRSGGQ